MTSRKPHNPINATGSGATAFNGAVTEVMGKSASVLGERMRAFQQEGVKFMARRIEDNMNALEQFGSCRSFPDFLAAQQKWLADTTRAYSQEMVKCGELMTQAFDVDKTTGNGTNASSPPRE